MVHCIPPQLRGAYRGSIIRYLSLSAYVSESCPKNARIEEPSRTAKHTLHFSSLLLSLYNRNSVIVCVVLFSL
ncbi:hypothetical protein L6452_19331 [Arctium lappa]|uniref:Uncharacterized protein n=1 Tax=Arctium lappa TaxID=4217 RepID=A0ACB9B7V5_ARCLA|nr:hypothetical protein L6452_19331 [Arctium lappa]